jgi:glucosamine-6-phosphate deaminase
MDQSVQTTTDRSQDYSDLLASLSYNEANVCVYRSHDALGAAAANQAADVIRRAIARRGRARIIIATGNSQLAVSAALVQQQGVDWKSVDIFHLDEYVGISEDHLASFRYWVRTRIVEKVHPASAEYMEGDARELDLEMERYTRLLAAGPIDLAFVGIGENGHIAFNDPGVADFNDPRMVKRVTLDEICRRQQVGEGHFKDMDSVPREAVTLTCSALFRAEYWVCCIPDARKAQAVRNSLEGPISPACPGSLVRRHPNTTLYLDIHSAALLEAAVPSHVSRDLL